MSIEFYALLGRMRYITRWGLMRNTFSENIQEHSHQVAVLAHALALIRRDVLTAKNAQAPCISLLWGFRDRKTLEESGAKYFCEKAEDLPALLEQIVGEVYGK